MKKLFYILSFLILVNSPLMATILRVNNQLPTNAPLKIFNTLQEAHNVAIAGDTLMIEGSPNPYENLTLIKPLTIIGTGFFLEENLETSSSKLLSIVGKIKFESGSQGSVLMGVVFDSGNTGITPDISVNNIWISRCFLRYPIRFIDSINGILITQNYFLAGAISISSSGFNFSSVVFKNNIVNGVLNTDSGANRVFSEVSNNVFLGTGTNTINIRTDIFRNNIIATNSTSIIILSTNNINNLTLSNQIIGNGNQLYDPTQLFLGATGNSTDGQYKLKENSPYKAAGFQGAEPGVFGGNTPYILSGLPPLPIIFDFSASSFGTQQNGLNVSIKAKTNN